MGAQGAAWDRQATRLLAIYGLDLEDHQIQADKVTVKAQPQLREQSGATTMKLLDRDEPWRGLRSLLVDCLRSKGFDLDFQQGKVVRRFYPSPIRDEGWL